MPDTHGRGFTVREIALRYRVGISRVIGWIRRRQLRAINRRDVRSGRPSWVVVPEALEEFERGRQVATPPPKPARRKTRTHLVDFFPD